MSKGGKIKYWEYYGTIAAAVCAGPVAALRKIFQNGEVIWTGPLSNPGGSYSTITIDARRKLRFYWGNPGQVADAVLSSYGDQHPPYEGLCYVVLDNYYFGRETPNSPSLQFEVTRNPQQSLVTGTTVDDGQASVAAIIADLLPNQLYGLALDAASIDTTSLQAAQDQTYGRRQDEYVSPLYTDASDARGIISELAAVPDLWMRLTGDKLEFGAWPSRATDIDVGSLPLWTFHDQTEPARVTAGGWDGVPTGWVINFPDRAREFKQSAEKWDDLRAMRVVGKRRRETITTDQITRRTQARSFGQRQARRGAIPGLDVQVKIRRGKGINVRPGDMVRIDIEPEPGGLQWQQVCRVIERTVPARGPISFRLEAERTLSPTPYTPESDLPPVGADQEPDDAVNVRIFELPPSATGTAWRLGALVERPDALVIGGELWMDIDEEGDFYRLAGALEDFALRARVDAAALATDTAIDIEMLSVRDLHILDDDPTTVASDDDALMLVLITVDGDGQIDEDGNGAPLIEFCSITSLALTSTSHYTVNVTRARLDGIARAFAAGAEAWIIGGRALRAQAFRHEALSSYANASQPLYIRVQTHNAWFVRELVDCTTHEFRFPVSSAFGPQITITSPTNGTNYTSIPADLRLVGSVIDANADLANLAVVLQGESGPAVTILAGTYPVGTASADIDCALPINAVGAWTVTITATDRYGLTGSQVLTYSVEPTGGVLAPIYIDGNPYTNAGTNRYRQVLSLFEGTPGATIWYAVTESSTPPSPPPGNGWVVKPPQAYPGQQTTAQWTKPLENIYIHSIATMTGYTNSPITTAYGQWHTSGGRNPQMWRTWTIL